jgi:hypothetical protein
MVLGLCFVEISSRTQELFESCFQSLADGAVKKKNGSKFVFNTQPSISYYFSLFIMQPL